MHEEEHKDSPCPSAMKCRMDGRIPSLYQAQRLLSCLEYIRLTFLSPVYTSPKKHTWGPKGIWQTFKMIPRKRNNSSENLPWLPLMQQKHHCSMFVHRGYLIWNLVSKQLNWQREKWWGNCTQMKRKSLYLSSWFGIIGVELQATISEVCDLGFLWAKTMTWFIIVKPALLKRDSLFWKIFASVSHSLDFTRYGPSQRPSY